MNNTEEAKVEYLDAELNVLEEEDCSRACVRLSTDSNDEIVGIELKMSEIGMFDPVDHSAKSFYKNKTWNWYIVSEEDYNKYLHFLKGRSQSVLREVERNIKMARTKLSKSDKLYIEQTYGAISIEQIAENVECTVKLVEEYIASEKLEPNEPKPEKAVNKKSHLDLAARKGPATAMTQALSEVGDTVKNSQLPIKTRNSVYKPFG